MSKSAPLSPTRAREIPVTRKPDWIRIRPPSGHSYQRIKGLLRDGNLHTVCEEARCPNLTECWDSGTATVMLGGDICTRACRFCAVKTLTKPPPLDPDEPTNVAKTIAELKLRYIVLTSVNRDDLPDQGANHFAETVKELKRLDNNILIEVLMPDFRGSKKCIQTIVDSGIDVFAHNIETVESLQYRVRDPRAGYDQSLDVLAYAKHYADKKSIKLHTKSSIMIGLGETDEELDQSFSDLRSARVDFLTLGQYLRPSLNHLPVQNFRTPEEYEFLGQRAKEKGFLFVASGPMVRSSYKAAEAFAEKLIKGNEA